MIDIKYSVSIFRFDHNYVDFPVILAEIFKLSCNQEESSSGVITTNCLLPALLIKALNANVCTCQ